MKKLSAFILFSALFLAACGGGNKEPIIPLPDGTASETVKLITKAMPTLKEQCPGFMKYGQALEFQELQTNSIYYPSSGKEASVTWILLKVPNDDKIIPNQYRAWGHTLYVGFDETGKAIILKKSTTQKVFLDRSEGLPTGKDYILKVSK